MPLDRFLADYDVNEVHSTRIAASPEAAMAAARGLTPKQVPLTVGLMAVRSVPLQVRRMANSRVRRGQTVLGLGRPVLDQFLDYGFVLLDEQPDELVAGAVARFWRFDGGIRRVTAEDFESFAEPGWAKAAFNFRTVPAGPGSTRLITETRIQGTDDYARRAFARYWGAIRLGSGLIRREWLWAIKRRAER